MPERPVDLSVVMEIIESLQYLLEDRRYRCLVQHSVLTIIHLHPVLYDIQQ